MATEQKFITVPTKVAQTTQLGDVFEVEGREFEVESIHRDEEGAQLELIREDDKQTTVSLDLESESELSTKPSDKVPTN